MILSSSKTPEQHQKNLHEYEGKRAIFRHSALLRTPLPRGGATGSKGHELILLQGAISCQAVVLSGARRDF